MRGNNRIYIDDGSNDSNVPLEQEELKNNIIKISPEEVNKIIGDIEEVYTKIKNNGSGGGKRYILRTDNKFKKGDIFHILPTTRLQVRLAKAFTEDREKNHHLSDKQQDFLVEKIALFLSSRETHELNLDKDCFNKKKSLAGLARDAIITIAYGPIGFFRLAENKSEVRKNISNCYIPDYNNETKGSYKKALEGFFESARRMDAQQLVKETEDLRSQYEVQNPLSDIRPIEATQAHTTQTVRGTT